MSPLLFITPVYFFSPNYKISKNDMRGKLLLTTRFETVLSNMPCDVTKLQQCNHSEADTRILLHLAHAAEQGHTTAYVRTVSSDVVILAIRFFETLGLTELLVGFGTVRKYCDIPVQCMRIIISKSTLYMYLMNLPIGIWHRYIIWICQIWWIATNILVQEQY